MLLHDTHFHLDLYNKQVPEIVKEIDANRIFTIAVTNLPVLFERLKKRVNSKYIRVALGFHPELISKYHDQTEKMWSCINQTKFIGEVGLDLKDANPNVIKMQTNFFEKLLDICNSKGGKILSVHSRGSENEILSMMPNDFNGKVILHWYSGSLKNLDKAIDKDCYFSINYQMLCSNKGQKIIGYIPNNRLLLESDGPFVEIKNRPFRPTDLDEVVLKLSDVRNIKKKSLMEELSRNLNELLNRYEH